MPCLFQSQGKLKLFFIPHGTLVVSAVSLELTVVPFFLSRRAEPSASATEKDKKKKNCEKCRLSRSHEKKMCCSALFLECPHSFHVFARLALSLYIHISIHTSLHLYNHMNVWGLQYWSILSDFFLVFSVNKLLLFLLMLVIQQLIYNRLVAPEKTFVK